MKTYEEHCENLSYNFRILRSCKHKTMEQVCKESGIAPQELTRFENCDCDSLETLLALCTYYGIALYLPFGLRFEAFEI